MSTNDKTALRQEVRKLKKTLSDSEKLSRSNTLMQSIEALAEFQQAATMLLYWSMTDEVQTHQLVERWHTKKKVLLPCVDGDNLLLRQYTGANCMHAGEQFGIGEPQGEIFSDIDSIDLIVVPGVAFDSHCNRMGRGRGFYDRLLATTPHAIKIGVAFDFQIFDTIPVEPFDQPMDIVVGETKTYTK